MSKASLLQVQWPDGLLPHGAAWDAIRRAVDAGGADLLVTSEMPFGPWFPLTADYDAATAERSVALHEAALDALAGLQVGAVVSSRPVPCGGRLANEAFVLKGGRYRYLHHEKFFPEEPGWREASWFARGRDGADVIGTPRATGRRTAYWKDGRRGGRDRLGRRLRQFEPAWRRRAVDRIRRHRICYVHHGRVARRNERCGTAAGRHRRSRSHAREQARLPVLRGDLMPKPCRGT